MISLTPIQSQVLAGLLAGKSVSAAARENGIHRSTIYEWRREHPSFQLALDQARARHQSALYDFVQDVAEQALETVAESLESDDPAIRLRSAQIILRIAGPGHRSPHLRDIDVLAANRPAQPPAQAMPPAVSLPADDKRGMEIEALADRLHAGSPKAGESDTIRQNPTLFSPPSRSSPCICGSGLKYKRCCGICSPGQVPEGNLAASAIA